MIRKLMRSVVCGRQPCNKSRSSMWRVQYFFMAALKTQHVFQSRWD